MSRITPKIDSYLPTKIFQFIVRPVIFLVCSIIYDIRVVGSKNINAIPKNYILAANHSNVLDPVFLFLAHPIRKFPLLFASNSKIIKENKFGQILSLPIIMKLLGATNLLFGQNDYNKSLAIQLKDLKSGYVVVIFPQGKISQSIDLTQVKGGVAYLAMVTGLPVVPIHIKKIDRQVRLSIGKPLTQMEIFGNQKTGVELCVVAAKNIMSKIMSLDN